MDTLTCAILVVLAIVLVAYFARRRLRCHWEPIGPPHRKPIGPPDPGAIAPTYPIIAAYCNVPELNHESVNTMVLEVKGVPPPSLAGCSATLHSAPGHPPLEGWNSPPLFVAEILPHATSAAGPIATLLLRPVVNGVLEGDLSLAGNPLGYVSIHPCH